MILDHLPIPYPSYTFYEHRFKRPTHLRLFCREPSLQETMTTISVVFDRESSHLFSSARILLYYVTNGSQSDDRYASNHWGIKQLGSVHRSFRDQVENAPANALSLPQLTIALEVVAERTASGSDFGFLVLRSPRYIQNLTPYSVGILLERELALTCDTSAISLSFTHSITLHSWAVHVGQRAALPQMQYATTCIVRVIPGVSSHPMITNGCLPIELLLIIFEDAEFRDSWRVDLLSFAQVCRAWSCALSILCARLISDSRTSSRLQYPLDVGPLARALSQVPLLGHTFRYFNTDDLGKPRNQQRCSCIFRARNPPGHDPVPFTSSLIAILQSMKNLQWLHLDRLDPWQAEALCEALCRLHDIATLSVGRLEQRRCGRKANGMLSVVQLMRCMTKWPELKSLTVTQLHRGRIFDGNALWRFRLHPRCALTQLSISESRLSDKDLMHLTASSARTLERVVLESIEGVSNAGLSTFLFAISQNVTHLAIQDVAVPPSSKRGRIIMGRKERALDVVVDKMSRLHELRIRGDVASEVMLERRRKMFLAHNDSSEQTRVPVVSLWVGDSRSLGVGNYSRLSLFVAGDEWPGWCTPDKVIYTLLNL